MGNFNAVMANAFILSGFVMGGMIAVIKVMNQKQMVLFVVCWSIFYSNKINFCEHLIKTDNVLKSVTFGKV